jgi:5'-nucleotidase
MERKLNMLRYLALLTLVLFSCSSPQKAPDSALYDQIVLVGTNDFHGYLKTNVHEVQGQKVISGGAEWFGGYINILKAKYGDRLVILDGGDLFQGTMESNYFLGKPVVDYYNVIGYTAAAVGNHEFDYGPRKKGDPDRIGALRDRIAQAKFPFLAANIFWKKNGKLWTEKNLHPSILITVNGHKIGIMGLTTPDTPLKTMPLNTHQFEYRDFLEPARAEAAKLRAQGAELVLVTTHEGSEKQTSLRTMLEQLPPGTIDAVVSGHAHQEVHELINGVPVIQSKTRGVFFGRIDLYIDKATGKLEPSLTRIHGMTAICGTWYKNSETCDPKEKGSGLFPLRQPTYEGMAVKPDPRITAVLKPYFAKTDELRKEVLGHAQRDFEYLPSGESEMGFLFLDAFKEKIPYARVSFHNGGGLRRKLLKGPLTFGDLYELHPFDNSAVVVKMSGRQLKDLVRVGVSGNNMVPFFNGVKASYHTGDSPAYERDVNGDGKKEAWERDRLASLVWEDTGKPVLDTETFWLSTNDYLATGGDGTQHVFDPIPLKDKRYLDISTRDLVANYLRKHKGLSLPPTHEMRLRKVD